MQTTNTEKIALVERLLEAKAINFREALSLLEVEKEYAYAPYPYPATNPYNPYDWTITTPSAGTTGIVIK